ncbi:hypothetical protein Bca4012_020253 [Brassica carinata]|uniref:Uncharacterized protein n=1 Tax=Brassica carinata TaxID=52824 RepID=A0A8X8BD95_BRACI|nr:hypothetical protein Bca52824_001338 [Brassica carinata]
MNDGGRAKTETISLIASFSLLRPLFLSVISIISETPILLSRLLLQPQLSPPTLGSANPSAVFTNHLPPPHSPITPPNAKSKLGSSSPLTISPLLLLPISRSCSLSKAVVKTEILVSFTLFYPPCVRIFPFPISPELTASLLAEDKVNGFRLMEPFSVSN